MKNKPLSSATVTASPALYRAYRTLEKALHSGSDSDLVQALNVYTDTAHKQGFLVNAATTLRNSISQQIIAEEKRLHTQAFSKTSPCQTPPVMENLPS